MQMYQVKVGNYTTKSQYTESAARKIMSEVKNCFLNQIELIPVKQGVSV